MRALQAIANYHHATTAALLAVQALEAISECRQLNAWRALICARQRARAPLALAWNTVSRLSGQRGSAKLSHRLGS